MQNDSKIFWITGPPASGKTTLCSALAQRLTRAVHIPVDEVRAWVVQGMADSVPWTDETERQFRIAEEAVCRSAKVYLAAGFDVLIDHCRNPLRLQSLIEMSLAEEPVAKICLLPDLEENLRRSHTRTNKPFDCHLLDETISWTNKVYREQLLEGWLFINNTKMGVDESVDAVLAHVTSRSWHPS